MLALGDVNHRHAENQAQDLINLIQQPSSVDTAQKTSAVNVRIIHKKQAKGKGNHYL